MNKLVYAEEVLELLLAHISLSRYDKKFFYNLQLMHVLPRKTITSNQADLFTKVVLKYHSQLLKKQYNSVELSELPWQLPITQSSPQFTNAHLEVNGDTLILRCPYKQQFVQDFRSLHLMNWHSVDKCYYCDFGLHTFKKVNEMVKKHYKEIVYSAELQDILAQAAEYKGDYIWNPTLVESNGRLYVAAINEPLYNAIADVNLATDFYALSKIASYGITVGKALFEKLLTVTDCTRETLTFMTNHQCTHEYTKLDELVELLKQIRCDLVVIGSRFGSWAHNDALVDKVKENGIEVANASDIDLSELKHNNPVFVKFNSFSYKSVGSLFASKIVQMVNSEEIKIK